MADRGSGESNSAPGAPKPSSSSAFPASSQPRDVYNDGFVDKSWDPDDYREDPGVNQMYSDSSLSNRPNLPYPGQHYDIYRGGNK